MASYNLIFKPSTEKDFRHLPHDMVKKILHQIESLKATPFPVGSTKLAGSKHLYRIRIGDYRVIYEIKTTSQEIVIHYIRHRKEAYRF